jgi:hypothetical protein
MAVEIKKVAIFFATFLLKRTAGNTFINKSQAFLLLKKKSVCKGWISVLGATE